MLAEAGTLDPDVAESAVDMARFRNLLVHGYAQVDDDRVIDIARTRLGELRRLGRALASTSR